MNNLSVPRLSKAQRSELRAQLQRWQTPATMLEAVGAVHSRTYFVQAGLEFLRDAWVGATLGDFLQSSAVRLVTDNRPDFELRDDGRVLAFEMTEVDHPDRRRGDEYREDDGRAQHMPVEKIAADGEKVPEWIEAACQRKLAIGYAPGTALVVHLNIGGEFGIGRDAILESLVQSTRPAKDAFLQVWVLWFERPFLCWNAGEPQRIGQGDVWRRE